MRLPPFAIIILALTLAVAGCRNSAENTSPPPAGQTATPTESSGAGTASTAAFTPPPPTPVGIAAVMIHLPGSDSDDLDVIPTGTAASYRSEADQEAAGGRYANAARSYRLEAAVYDRLGDPNAAAVERTKAARWDTKVDIYATAPADRGTLLKMYSQAKYEPLYGCYLGAYVGNDTSLDPNPSGTETSSFVRRTVNLGNLIGKPLATAWDYLKWGDDFPTEWASGLTAAGIAPHIAWEPDNLNQVQDNDYLRQFAAAAAAVNGPVFIRFAGEMNGEWTPYHADPAAYRAKFKLVHDVLAGLAPNVAMIWCVNSIPDYNYDQYYPGDNAVDWVGVNIYSVIHHDNDPSRPAEMEQPTALLDKVYAEYAPRKPIAICEFGASHQESLDMSKDYSNVAEEKIANLLAALPRKYPRVKMVGFFDSDNLTATYVQPGRQLSNYSVTDNPQITATLRQAVSDPYYLPAVVNDGGKSTPSTMAIVADSSRALAAPITLSSCVQTYTLTPTVVTLVDGAEIGRDQTPGEHAVVAPAGLSPGAHTVTVQVYDETGKLAGRRSAKITAGPAQVNSGG